MNRVVRALHSRREPLGRTIFQIHGKFAELLGQLRDIPPVDFVVPKIDKLDQESLAAIIEPQQHAELSPEIVAAYLREHLAPFKIPRHIEFRNELPREDSGKLFKRKLRDPFWADVDRTI